MQKDFFRTSGRIAVSAVLSAVLLIVLGLFLLAMFATTEMKITSVTLETVIVHRDSFLLSLLTLMLGVGILILMYRLTKYLPRRAIPVLIFLYTMVIGVVWVLCSKSAPNHDSGMVTLAGHQMALGNADRLAEAYFRYYPFQLGYVAWTELWCAILVHGKVNYIALQVVNLVCLGIGAASLWGISDRFLGKKELGEASGRLFLLLYLAFPQAIWFSTFLYGNIPAFGFAALAVYLMLLYFENERPIYAVFSILSILLSIWLKLNSMIVFVAMVICFLVHLWQEKRWRTIPLLVALLLLVPLGKNLPITMYEARTGLDFGEGIPMLSWAHMGLSTAHGNRPGWYNGNYTRVVFDRFEQDPEKTAAYSIEGIKTRISEFIAKPEDAIAFFGLKIESQWNETTFQSIWNNLVRGSYGERNGIAKLVCDENSEVFASLCDIAHTVSLLGAIFGLLALLRRMQARDMIISLIFLGGFLYHLIFEAKSQYVLTYMLWILPISAYGYAAMATWMKNGIFAKIKGNEMNETDKSDYSLTESR